MSGSCSRGMMIALINPVDQIVARPRGNPSREGLLGMQHAIGLTAIGGDHQIGRAAANVDTGQPQGWFRLVTCRINTRSVPLELKERINPPLEFLRQFAVKVNQLRGAGLVPVDRQVGPPRNRG